MQVLNAALHEAHSKHAENTASPQLRQAANEFEANFLQELLKPLSDDAMFGSGDDGDTSGSMGTISSIAAQALADGIAKDGGLGIAKRVLAELTPVEAAESSKNGSLGEPECGGCSRHPRLGAEDTSGASSVEMLGQGSLSNSAQSPAVENLVHSANGDDKMFTRRVSAVGKALRN
jgi:Rod binding domain-containing protein